VDWASRLIPALTPMDMGTYMDEHIFRVLEMKSTGFRPQDPNPQCFTRLLNRGIGSVPTPVPAVPPVDSGGAGLYSTAEDYGKFLSAMLSGSLLRQETVDEMFRAQLEGQQYTMFRDAMREHHESMCPWADSSQHLQHGLSGVLNLTAVPGKRKEGSMSWVAMNNCHWVSSSLFEESVADMFSGSINRAASQLYSCATCSLTRTPW
jgi:CubicO group peptidase (beta-lactamase class C family)